ncbi:MAG TPA: hypothetical protein VG297_01465 [Bryobacteraceae bacterium]|nr:hypothetical protein [Bryobacteraceae bacterium]
MASFLRGHALMGVARFANRMDDDGAGRIDFADEGSGLVGHEFASDNVAAVAMPGTGDTAV